MKYLLILTLILVAGCVEEGGPLPFHFPEPAPEVWTPTSHLAVTWDADLICLPEDYIQARAFNAGFLEVDAGEVPCSQGEVTLDGEMEGEVNVEIRNDRHRAVVDLDMYLGATMTVHFEKLQTRRKDRM